MTVEELEAAWRIIVSDRATPRLWSGEDFLGWLNEAEVEACRRARLLVDTRHKGGDSNVCRIVLTNGVALYELDPRVIYVRRAMLMGRTIPLEALDYRDMDYGCPGWESHAGGVTGHIRNLDSGHFRPYRIPASLAPTAFTGVTGAAATDLLTKAGHTLVNGDVVVPTLLSTTEGTGLSNDAPYFVVEVAGNDFKLSDESGGTAIDFTSNITDCTITKIPASSAIVDLTVVREPLEAMDDDADSPEIPARYHRALLDWVAYRAYDNTDVDTYNANAAKKHLDRFEREFGTREKSSAMEEEWQRLTLPHDMQDGTY